MMRLVGEYFDEVWCWAVDNPLKTSHGASLLHRQQMLALTIQGLAPHIQHHSEFTSPWTAESAAIIHYLHPDRKLWVALGSDALAQVEQWYAFQLLIARIQGFVEVARDGTTAQQPTVGGLPVLTLTRRIPPHTSHTLRTELAAGATPTSLPPQVLTYIQAHGLYH